MANNTMGRVDILTVKQRSKTIIERFWKQHGFQPVFWDNTDKLPGIGRNIILNNFYNSDRKWLIMVDDDVIIDTERGDGKTFLQNIDQILNAIGDEVTSFSVMNNILHRVATTLKNPVVKDSWCFLRNYWIGNIVFHRNTGQKYYNHETDILEDQDWCLHQLKDKQRIAILMNVVLKSISSQSLLFNNNDARVKRYKQARERLLQDWPMLIKTKNKKIMKTKMINHYWPTSLKWKSETDLGISFRITK